MNKKLFTMSLAMMGLCTFTACSSSNDDDKKDDPKEIVIQDAEYDAIINQYVDNVVMPTYRDLKDQEQRPLQCSCRFRKQPLERRVPDYLRCMAGSPRAMGVRVRPSSSVL